MKILILNQHFYPEVAATGQLATDLAEDLVKKGLAVTVVTGMPSYVKDKQLRKVPHFEHYRGIKIYRVITTSFDKNDKVGRIINYLTFFVFALLKVFTIPRSDIVITMSTPPFISIIGVILKKMRRMKLFYWVQDLYPDIAIAIGVIRENGLLARVFKKLSRVIYRNADVMVPIGEKMADRLIAQGVDWRKVKIIHNWADPEDYSEGNGPENPIREQLGLNEKFVLLYSGNIGMVHEFETVKEAMVALKEDESLAFLFIGDGVKKKDLESFVGKHDLKNVHFLPFQPREVLKYSMNAGNALLITQNDRSAGLMVPSKIYAALAVGKPVLAVGPEKSELFEIIQRQGCGVFLNDGGVQPFVEAIHHLSRNPGQYEYGPAGLNQGELIEYSRSSGTEKFLDLLSSH